MIDHLIAASVTLGAQPLLPMLGCRDWAAKTGLPGLGCQDWTARTGPSELGRQNKEASSAPQAKAAAATQIHVGRCFTAISSAGASILPMVSEPSQKSASSRIDRSVDHRDRDRG